VDDKNQKKMDTEQPKKGPFPLKNRFFLIVCIFFMGSMFLVDEYYFSKGDCGSTVSYSLSHMNIEGCSVDGNYSVLFSKSLRFYGKIYKYGFYVTFLTIILFFISSLTKRFHLKKRIYIIFSFFLIQQILIVIFIVKLQNYLSKMGYCRDGSCSISISSLLPSLCMILTAFFFFSDFYKWLKVGDSATIEKKTYYCL
jgi:hypothetical protein